MLSGLIPAFTKKSAIIVLNLVYPDLKSSPTTNTLFFLANSITPGTREFYGLPFIYEQFSIIVASA